MLEKVYRPFREQSVVKEIFTTRDLIHADANEWVNKEGDVKYFSKSIQIELPDNFVRVKDINDADLIIISSECKHRWWFMDNVTEEFYRYGGYDYPSDEHGTTWVYELKEELLPAKGKPFVYLHEISFLKSKLPVLSKEEFDTTMKLFDDEINEMVGVGILNASNVHPYMADILEYTSFNRMYHCEMFKNKKIKKLLKEYSDVMLTNLS